MSDDRDPSGKWEQAGVDYTVNETNDPGAPGGYYLSQKDLETGDHATAVFNGDDTLADTKGNRKDWPEADDTSDDSGGSSGGTSTGYVAPSSDWAERMAGYGYKTGGKSRRGGGRGRRG